MDKVPLRDIIEISKGKQHTSVFSSNGNGKKRYIQIDDLRNDINLKYTDQTGIEVNESDLIIAWDGANAGTIGFNLSGYIGSTLARLRIKNKAFDSKFLGSYLRSKSKELRQYCTGATIPHISKAYLESIQIPKLDLSIQKQIAQILEEVDIARQKRKAANGFTDQFLQSTFLSMFGDPVSNPNNYNKYSIRSLATKYSDGPFGSNLKSEHYTLSGILVIRLENIGINQFKESSLSYISDSHYKKLQKHTCFPGDVIIGTMGEPNLRACILPNHIELAINKADCVLFRANKDKVLPEFISYLINMPSFIESVSNLVLGQTRGRISMGRLSTVEVIVPPIELQQKFTSIVADTEQLRQKQKQSEVELENLFQALLQKYFN